MQVSKHKRRSTQHLFEERGVRRRTLFTCTWVVSRASKLIGGRAISRHSPGRNSMMSEQSCLPIRVSGTEGTLRLVCHLMKFIVSDSRLVHTVFYGFLQI